jgi:hypothetical protein
MKDPTAAGLENVCKDPENWTNMSLLFQYRKNIGIRFYG